MPRPEIESSGSFVISTGIVFYVDGLSNLYRRDVELFKPIVGDRTPLEILHGRFKNRGIIDGFVALLPDSGQYQQVAQQAEALGIKTIRYAVANVLEKPLSLRQQRWNLEDDSGNDTWVGAAFAQVIAETSWKTMIMMPLRNLLIEPAAVFDSLQLHRREGFDLCAAEERISGAAWHIFEADLLSGLMKSHPELMWARGGLAWAVRKPLYPFKSGAYHCPRIRPAIHADLRLNSLRAQNTLAATCSPDFASPEFSYEQWLARSGWEKHFSDFAPQQVNVEPASLCNGECFGCAFPKMQRQKTAMTPDVFARLHGAFSPGDDCRWVFSGMGEPLLNPFLNDMIQAVAGFSSMLITSLQKLPGEEFPFAALDQIRISTDALSEETFGKARPGCNWKNIETFLSAARNRKRSEPDRFPELGITMLRNSFTESQMQPFINYWKQVVKPVFRENFFRWPFDLPPEQVQWYQILGESTFAGALARTSKVDYRPVRRRPCRSALLSATVLSNGQVTICPCDYEGKFAYADVKTASLKEIWQSGTAREFRRQHLEMAFNDELPCRLCPDWYHPI